MQRAVLLSSGILLSLLVVPAASTQVVPAAPTAAPRPGLPPRDSPAAATTGTARIRGRVFAADTNAALRRAQVIVAAPEQQVRRFVTTDADGRYDFGSLPAGRYTVTASKGGYVSLQYGQRRPFEPGRTLTLATGQELTQVDVTLPRGGVITGRITDEFAEPVTGAMVRAQRYQYGPGGQRRLVYSPGVGLVQTDDLGQFRLFGLMPGDYVVNAMVRMPMALSAPNPADAAEGFAPTYFPGTVNPAEAQSVSVGIGEETSIQMVLQATRMAHVSGTVVDSAGKPVSGGSLMLRSSDAGGSMMGMAGRSLPDGAFALANIAPGDYEIAISVTPATPDAVPEYGAVPVTVGGDDVTGVRIVTGPGAVITGRVIFEGTAPKNGLNMPPRVNAQPIDPENNMAMMRFGGEANGVIADDGRFQIRGAVGTVFFRVQVATNWMLKSITLDGRDITDVPYELGTSETIEGLSIVLTDRVTEVSGGVSSSRGESLKDYAVVVQPASVRDGVDASRSIRVARPDQDGRYRVRNLPPGDYLATAVESLEQGGEWDPELQPKLREAASSFTLKEGDSRPLDLKLAEGL